MDPENEEIKKAHDLFNVKRVSINLFAFLVFWTSREYLSSAFKLSLETRETSLCFGFVFNSFKKKATKPLQSYITGRKSSKESTKDRKQQKSQLCVYAAEHEVCFLPSVASCQIVELVTG